MAVLDVMAVVGFAQQFLGVLGKLIKDRQKRERFQNAVVEQICDAFSTEPEARFVLEKVLSRDEVCRLFLEPATLDRRQKLLEFFSAEVDQAGIASWQDFGPKAERFINDTVDIQLAIFGTAGEVATTDILKREINSLQELIHKLGQPKTTREEYLSQVAAESRENCIARWEAAGVSYDLARELADDLSVGAPNASLRSRFEKSTIWLVGEFGVGKSLLVERLFQEAVIDAIENEYAPIPVFLRARDIASDGRRLRDIVDASLPSLKDTETKRVVIFVDGVDEASRNFADNLKVDIRTIQSIKPETHIFITSRFLRNPSFSDSEQSLDVPKMQDAERLHLMSRISGQEIGKYQFHSSPEALNDAITRPLFAILMANYLRHRTYESTLSTGELLSTLVEQSLERALAKVEDGFDRLKKLAILTIERDAAVQLKEIGSQLEVQPLLNTRLVVERSGAVEFPLPVLAQWFAAQSLVSNDFPLDRLLDDPRLLEKWRYPLTIFVASNSYETVLRILGPVVERYPAFASSIVSESLVQRAGVLPAPEECGQRLREAMQTWITGIGPLARLIAPVSVDNKVQPIKVSTFGSVLSYSWYAGTAPVNDIQVWRGKGINDGTEPLSRDWPRVSNLREGDQLAWPWRVTLDHLSGGLSGILRKRALPVITNKHPIWNEALWKLALKITGRGSLHDQPVRISKEVQKRLEIYESANLRVGQLVFADGTDSTNLQQIILGLGNNFHREVNPPWPGPDKPFGEGGHYVWSPYSNEQILVRTQAVYQGALEIYRHLVQAWFPTLSSRLDKYVLFPLRFVGMVTPPGEHPENGHIGPIIEYYFEPLPDGEQTFVDIKLAGEYEERLRSKWSELEFFEELSEQVKVLRPESSNWITFTIKSTVMIDVFSQARPATEIAYDWLWDDLKKIAWVDGTFTKYSREEKLVFSLSEVLE